MEEQNNNLENIEEKVIYNEVKQIKPKKKKIIALVVAIISAISVISIILLNVLINTSKDSLMYVPTRVKITYEDGSISYTDIKYNSNGFIEKIDFGDDSIKFEYDKNGNITKAIYDSISIGGDWIVEYLYKDGLLIEQIYKDEFTDWKCEEITRYNYNEKGECVLKTRINAAQYIYSYSYQYEENGRIKRETYMQAHYNNNTSNGFDYDDDGNLFGFKLGGSVSVKEYIYNEAGNEVKILKTTKDDHSKHTSISYETYDDKNNLIEDKYIYDDYSNVRKYKYTYDSNNNPIEVIALSTEQYKYEYEYEAIRTNSKKIDQILAKCNLFMHYIPILP